MPAESEARVGVGGGGALQKRGALGFGFRVFGLRVSCLVFRG